jgi:NAD(P)-dependent dehydrogenase (short-subunit alcohol dehydrogenase family)
LKEDKIFVITGATSGIGRATALAIAHSNPGATLILIGRDEIRGGRICRQILSRYPISKVEFHRTDISSFEAIRDLAKILLRKHSKIDVLINNAGARYDRFQKSDDGFELTFATNYLGHFLLTNLLMESLLGSGGGRVVTVSSSVHQSAEEGDDWLVQGNQYDRKKAYARSKLANILFAFELARRMRGTNLVSNAVDPGVVATRFARNNGLIPWAKHILSHSLRGDLTSATSGADTIVYIATEPEIADISGKLIRCRKEVAASSIAQDSVVAANLWAKSIRWTGCDTPIGL